MMLAKRAVCPHEVKSKPRLRTRLRSTRRDDHVDLNLLDAADLDGVDDVIGASTRGVHRESRDDVRVLRAGHIAAEDDHLSQAGADLDLWRSARFAG